MVRRFFVNLVFYEAGIFLDLQSNFSFVADYGEFIHKS